MKTTLKILILSSLTLLMAFSCEKGEQTQPEQQDQEQHYTTHQAQGTIIANFNKCDGYWVMIEVENPLGIGDSGSFTPLGGSKIKYKNAIGVPYFERLPNLQTNAKDTIGTWLNFEYRELTYEERHSNIFVDTSYHYICLQDLIPPSAKRYIITKVADYH